ncbi:MAG: PucR family transcriptional regulator ligand-binding domain-containing protein [Lutispora sp.]|nr:PucR family transcriptional regulator ligand-binding domain-containing protein [Lutispora sp.]MDD4834421.1 PucR family transcriptional regulator ligand-binding domain-containing protein [Lutispora sp.]
MYGVTLKEILENDELEGVKVIAGSRGLDRIVTSVNIMEVPDIDKWVKPGELLLTTGFAIKDDANALQKLIPLLSSKKLAGLGIKPKRYISGYTDQMIQMAESLDFPIIEFPQHMSYSDLIQPILGHITNRQAEFLKKIEYANNRLMDIMVNYNDLNKIVLTVEELIGNPVEIDDIDNNVLATSITKEEKEEIVPVKLPIIALNNTLGYMKCYELNGRISKIDMITLERTTAIIALEFLNQGKIKEIARHYKDQFLIELTSGSITDVKQIIQRARQLNWNLEQEYAILILDCNMNSYEVSQINNYQEFLIKMYDIADSSIKAFEKKPIMGIAGSNILMLLPVKNLCMFYAKEAGESLVKFGNYLSKEYKKLKIDTLINIGIGKPYSNPAELYKSFSEAKKALKISKAMYSKKNVMYYEDLGIFQLFQEINSDGMNFVNNIISPLAEYDQKKDSSLMKTLEEYFNSNGNIKQVAQKMYIHYNTAIYRIDQIQKLLEVDLSNPDDRLNVEIALKLKHYLDL